MILNPADRDASALLSLAASQNGPFLYIQTSWSLISCNWFYSLCRLSSVQTELGRIIPPSCFFFFFFFLVLKSSRLGESRCHLSPCLSRFFIIPHLPLSADWAQKSNLFGFSYATVRGMTTSWQGTSRQLETSFPWHLLSNCCSWTVNPIPPSRPSAPH